MVGDEILSLRFKLPRSNNDWAAYGELVRGANIAVKTRDY
jgi:hypothetical protein